TRSSWRFRSKAADIGCGPRPSSCDTLCALASAVHRPVAGDARASPKSTVITSVGAGTFHAFPRPQELRRLRGARGLDAERLTRLHGIADGALEGTLPRRAVAALPEVRRGL